MRAIVCVDEKWGIGKKNDLLFSIPKDMDFFRKTTSGKVIVMGSNTLKSFPNGKPLKNRVNIVLYPGGEKRDDCIVVDSMEELSLELKELIGDMQRVFGTRVNAIGNDKKGRIYIDYYTRDDLDRLAELLEYLKNKK